MKHYWIKKPNNEKLLKSFNNTNELKKVIIQYLNDSRPNLKNSKISNSSAGLITEKLWALDKMKVYKDELLPNYLFKFTHQT